MSQIGFAQFVGVSTPTIQAVEAGKLAVSQRLAFKIQSSTGALFGRVYTDIYNTEHRLDFTGYDVFEKPYTEKSLKHWIAIVDQDVSSRAESFAQACKKAFIGAAKERNAPLLVYEVGQVISERLGTVDQEVRTELSRALPRPNRAILKGKLGAQASAWIELTKKVLELGVPVTVENPRD